METLSEFLAKFADLLLRETAGEIALDGRRLGFIYRNILANRSVELAKNVILGETTCPFSESARYVVQASIPIALNDESIKREEAIHKMEVCFELLSSYFEKDSEIERVNLIYELFTTGNLMRKAEILLTENLGLFASSKAWTDLIGGDSDISLLAYSALQVEARRPGTVPKELLESLCSKVKPDSLSTKGIPNLKGESIEYVEEVEALLSQSTDLGKLVAYDRVRRLLDGGTITPAAIEEAQEFIQKDIETFVKPGTWYTN